MNGSADLISHVEYKDRRAGLIFFGALAIGVGALCAILVPLLFLALFLMPPSTSGLNGRTTVTAVMSYSAMAAVLIWLGIGSILCRRWARTLLLILSWSWLLAGILLIGIFVWFAQASFPTDAADPIIWIAMIITAIFCVALPGAMGLFYQSKHVKATCEARDPAPNWTDKCPLPVLTNSLWLGLGSLWLLASSLTNQGVVPMFGYLLSGTLASLVLLICSAAGFYLAWTGYQLKTAAWWGTLAAFALASLSAAITFARVDLLEFYRKSGYSEQQITQIGNLGFFTGRFMAWSTIVFFFLFLVYLLWIKKYFDKTAEVRG
jgi:MFS family permease